MPRGNFLEEAAGILERYYVPVLKQEYERGLRFLEGTASHP